MKQIQSLLLLLFTLTTLFSISSCGNDDDMPEPQNYELTVQFSHNFNGKDFAYDVFDYTNEAGNIINFTTIRYLISDIELVKADGSILKMEDKFAYINPKEGYNDFVLNEVPKGDYKGLNFVIGLDSISNHSNPNLYEPDHPLNPLINNMHWSWAGGYIFLSLEGHYQMQGNPGSKGFSYHIGLLENRMPIQTSEVFTLDKAKTLQIEMMMEECFRNPNMIDIDKGNVTHSTSDGGLATNIKNNTLNAFKIVGVE